MDKFSVTLLPAYEGDCILIEYGDPNAPHRILIDGGRKRTYEHLQRALIAQANDLARFELLVITHIDRDHIEGVVEILNDPAQMFIFNDIWFNGYQHLIEVAEETFGPRQAEQVSARLVERKMKWNTAFSGRAVLRGDSELPTIQLQGGLELTILSPTAQKLEGLIAEWENACRRAGISPGGHYTVEAPGEEIFGPPNVEMLSQEPFIRDDAAANGSSIALKASYQGKHILLAADSHSETLEAGIRLLPEPERVFDVVKVSHHGSSRNTPKSLLDLVKAKVWLFSTNGSYFRHPSPSTVARIIRYAKPATLGFNYRTPQTEMWDIPVLKSHWGYETMFPSQVNAGTLTVDLL